MTQLVWQWVIPQLSSPRFPYMCREEVKTMLQSPWCKLLSKWHSPSEPRFIQIHMQDGDACLCPGSLQWTGDSEQGKLSPGTNWDATCFPSHPSLRGRNKLTRTVVSWCFLVLPSTHSRRTPHSHSYPTPLKFSCRLLGSPRSISHIVRWPCGLSCIMTRWNDAYYWQPCTWQRCHPHPPRALYHPVGTHCLFWG